MNRFVGLVLAFALCVTVGACGGGGGGLEELPEAPLVQYRLGPGDRLSISVFGQEDLGGEFAVDNTNMVQMPLIGPVLAGGATTTELQARIEERLRDGYLANPRVGVEMLNFRPFYILGEVTKPGNYDYVGGLTVVNAVAMAEGFTYRADTRRVFIKRAGESMERAYALTAVTPVLPGDTIRIPDRRF
ncbi:MAG: polysaccharide export protein [Caulobacterales bacterium]|nr:polysaccharide export protein [Caulobacterales bacterium]